MIPISKQGKVKYPSIESTRILTGKKKRILTGNSQKKKTQMSNKHKMISNFVSHQEKNIKIT